MSILKANRLGINQALGRQIFIIAVQAVEFPLSSFTTYQKLEDACARAEAPCTTSTQQRDEPYSSPSYVPTRIREIADQCLSPSRQHKEQISPSHNSALQNELRRAQDMLDQSRQDCKSLSAKYLAVSDKVSSPLAQTFIFNFDNETTHSSS